uniref:hypothetical protein n=1 Tax=uncultured Methylophaga sp. TaxID=285271 RepID=UPI00259CDE42
ATKKRELYSSLPDCQLNFLLNFLSHRLSWLLILAGLYDLPRLQEGRILREHFHESNTKS